MILLITQGRLPPVAKASCWSSSLCSLLHRSAQNVSYADGLVCMCVFVSVPRMRIWCDAVLERMSLSLDPMSMTH